MMICPVCFAHLYHSHARDWREQLIKLFTRSRPYICAECGWRGILSSADSTPALIKQTLLGWVLGVVMALGIAWYLISDMHTQYMQPTAAGAEMKLFER